jgi:uncharacterized protein YdeI (YjbR/CyaY-like superfamily)
MGQKIPEVDAYIAKSAKFARPILTKIRQLFHEASPLIEEEMKWSFPHFVYKGIVGSMAAFKQHVSLGFWKAALMTDPLGLLHGVGETSMGRTKIASLDQLPPDKQLLGYIREALALNESGAKVAKPKKNTKAKPEELPDDLAAALQKNKKAKTAFAAFSPSHRKEYVEWITEAKQEATRKKRLQTALEWMAEGKSRHWKYQRNK